MTRWALVGAGLLLMGCGPVSSAATPSAAESVVSDEEVSLTVRIVGLRNRAGSVLILVHDQEDGFPGDAELALDQARIDLSALPAADAPSATFRISRREVGVAVFHDENDNHELDTSFIGIPTEGLGASNDAQGMFGPPDYDDAKVRLVQSSSQLDVEVIYFL